MSSSLVLSSKSHRKNALGTNSRHPPREQLGRALDAFESELLKSKHDGGLTARFKNLRGTGKLPDLTEVVRLTEEISNDCAARHGGWRQYALRVTPFLERIRQFASIGDVLVGGAQNMIASGVWAAVRLAVETSLSFLSFFDKVSDILFRASKSFLLHHDFASIFPQSEQLQDLAFEYLTVTVVMSTKIVQFAHRSGWSQMASSFTSSFDTNFNPLENQLKEIGIRIQLCTNALAMKASQQSHALTHRLMSSLQASVSQESRLRALEASKHGLLTALCPNQGDFDAIYRQYRRKGHSTWLLNEPKYRRWASSSSSGLLWIRGKMGSGKSISMASAVADLTLNEGNRSPLLALDVRSENSQKPTPNMTASRSCPTTVSSICYFFCTSSSPTTLKASTILGSITYQVLCSTSVSESLTDYIRSHSTTRKLHMGLGPEACVDLMIDVLPKAWMGCVVIDGLDECSSSDVTTVFEELHRLSEFRAISILSSCRTLWKDFNSASALFGELSTTITIDDIDRFSEAEAYITDKIQSWKKKHLLSNQSANLIHGQLHNGWQGMFLWLALQCEVISEDLSNGFAIGDIISRLPRDLPELYHGVLLRIENKKFASRIFKLVAAADHAMSIDELRVAANVIPKTAAWNPKYTEMTGPAFLRQHGGPLLEMDENRKVLFIHHSVVMHLLGEPINRRAKILHFDSWDAEKHLGFVLITYLNLPELNQSVTPQQSASPTNHTPIPEKIIHSVPLSSLARKALQHLRPSPHRHAVPPLDIADLLLRVQQTKPKPSLFNQESLLDYSKKNWLTATKRLDPFDETIRQAFEALVQGKTGTISTSLISLNPISWAVSHQHKCLLEYALSRYQDDMEATIHELNSMNPEGLELLKGPSLLPIAVRLLEDGSVGQESLDLLQCIFQAPPEDESDGYVRSITARLRSLAPIFMQILIMYTWSDHVACAMLRAVSQWMYNESLLYENETAIQLAQRFQKSSNFIEAFARLPTGASYHERRGKETIKQDSTPLIRAYKASDMECFKLLLDFGADLDEMDGNGSTILMHTVARNDTKVLSRLLLMGASVAARDNQGRTALHYASRGHSAEALQDLLQSDAIESIKDAQNRDGLTALHLACLASCETSLVTLIEAGVRIGLTNNEDKTPMDLLAWRLRVSRQTDHEIDGNEKICNMIQLLRIASKMELDKDRRHGN